MSTYTARTIGYRWLAMFAAVALWYGVFALVGCASKGFLGIGGGSGGSAPFRADGGQPAGGGTERGAADVDGGDRGTGGDRGGVHARSSLRDNPRRDRAGVDPDSRAARSMGGVVRSPAGGVLGYSPCNPDNAGVEREATQKGKMPGEGVATEAGGWSFDGWSALFGLAAGAVATFTIAALIPEHS